MGWGSGNLGGGSGGLNFKIVGGTSEPSNPKENTIWVNTDTDITSWIFGVDEPAEPVDGMVWITVGTSSGVAFNALKKNAIEVYPMSAKQYVGGAWVDREAKSYQNGEWVDWWNALYIYNNGDQCTDVTGGWMQTKQCTITQKADCMVVAAPSGSAGSAATINKIDLTDFTVLVFMGYSNKNVDNNIVYIANASPNFNHITSNVASVKIPQGSAPVEVRLDIAGITGEYNIGCGASASTVYCYELYLE